MNGPPINPIERVDCPVDVLLAAYAAGALDPALMALVGAHLDLRPKSRAFLAALETAAGGWLAELEPAPFADRDRRLAAACAAIDAAPEDAPATVPIADADDALPPSLRRYLGRASDALAWTTRPDGVAECVISRDRHAEVVVLRAPGGTELPTHEHAGLELTLVLTGGFRDAAGRYGPGDICVADETRAHRPVIDPGGDCVCFAVTVVHVRLPDAAGRLLRLLVR